MTFCLHRRETIPHRDDEGEYTRCLDCGSRLPFKDTMPLKPPTRTQEGKPRELSASEKAFQEAGKPAVIQFERKRGA